MILILLLLYIFYPPPCALAPLVSHKAASADPYLVSSSGVKTTSKVKSERARDRERESELERGRGVGKKGGKGIFGTTCDSLFQ